MAQPIDAEVAVCPEKPATLDADGAYPRQRVELKSPTELTHRHAQADEAGGGPPVLRGHQRIVDAEDAQRAAR